jgi:hypothetical protein
MPVVDVSRRLALISSLTLPLCLVACSKADPSGAPSAPPAKVTSKTSEWSVAGVVHGRTETSTTEPAVAPPPTEAPPAPTPQPAPQSGLLTAGDVDDLLNPAQYAAYAGRFLQKQQQVLPFVDTRTRVAIQIVDAKGHLVPFARIDVRRPGKPLNLVTAADGTASFYPGFDHVPIKTSVSVTSRAGKVTRPLDLSGHGTRRLAIALPGTAPAVTAMDLALVIDTTGSMGDEMAYLRTELDAIVTRLKHETGAIDLRIGVIVYRDEGDEYVVQSTPFTADIGSTRAMLARQEAGGGGDIPEAVDQAMVEAERLQWRPDAVKALLLVTDAPPHEDKVARTLDATQHLRMRGIQIVPVAASGVDDTAQYVMRTMAALTQGRYIFLTDDSGVGDAHAEPDVACYVVTRLDQMVARVLAGIAEGKRIEPAPGEVIRTVGNYDRGHCGVGETAPHQG